MEGLKMRRRGFMGLLAAAAIAGLFSWRFKLFHNRPKTSGSSIEPQLRGFFGVTSRIRDSSAKDHYGFTVDVKPKPGSLSLSGGNSSVKSELPFWGHTVDFDSNGRWAYSFQKWGRHGAIVDRASGRPLHLLHSGKDRRFFGHALLDEKNERIIVAEHNDRSGRGELSLRDMRTGKVISYAQSGGIYPHDMRMLADRSFVVINAFVSRIGDTSRMCEFDLETMTIVRSLDIPFEKGTALHMNVLPDQRIAIAGRAYDGDVNGHLGHAVIVQPDNTILPLEIPAHVPKEQFLDELINLASSPEGDLVATALKSDYVHRWSSADGIYKDSLHVPGAMGLVHLRAEGSFLVSSAKDEGIFICNFRKKTVVRANGVLGGNGSHLGFVPS